MFSLECLSKLFEQARNGNAQARDQLVLDNTAGMECGEKIPRQRIRAGGSVSDRLYWSYEGN